MTSQHAFQGNRLHPNFKGNKDKKQVEVRAQHSLTVIPITRSPRLVACI